MISQLRNINLWLVLFTDMILLCSAHILAYALRFGGEIPPEQIQNIQLVLPWLLAIKLIFFYLFGLYQGMWRYSGLVDIVSAFKATLIIVALTLSLILLLNRFEGFSRSVFILDGIFTFLAICVNRLFIRFYHQRFCRLLFGNTIYSSPSKKKLIILGAGDAGEKVAREVIDNPAVPYQIQGFLDDDRNKVGKRIHGIPVIASTSEVCVATEKAEAQELLIAMPSADKEQINKVVERCRHCGVPYKIVPGLGEIISDQVSINSIRDVSYKDLLGRPPVELENEKIEEIVRGKTVLITGAGGSIGSELCRQILRFEPGLLVFLDTSEQNLHRIETEVLHEQQFEAYVTVLGKVQNRELLNNLFSQYKPDMVLHAAACKHVPLLEKNPWEAVYNNVFASHQLIQAAVRHQTRRFILVSTDKAVRPTNVMGASKRVTEMLMQAHCREAQTRFMAVRFGNVLGSSGSVIPLFRKQIEKGGPVTVTHPEITRYFMSIEESAQLILQAAAMGNGGEIFLLEMGTPVRIAQMAEDYIQLCGKEPHTEIEIKYIGMRPGEKLYEELITGDEGVLPTRHDKIMVLQGQDVSMDYLHPILERLKGCSQIHDAQGIQQTLKMIIPDYHPSEYTSVFDAIQDNGQEQNSGGGPDHQDRAQGRVLSLSQDSPRRRSSDK